MTSNQIVNTINTTAFIGLTTYLAATAAKKLNLTEVWERNVPLDTPRDRVIASKMETNLLTGKVKLDLLRQVPIMNETAVVTVGAIFGIAIGFAGQALFDFLEGKSTN